MRDENLETFSSSGPVFDTIVAKLNAKEPIAYTKLNHGFWERLVRIERFAGTLDVTDQQQARELDRRTGPPFFLESGFLKEFLGLYCETGPRLRNIIFAAGFSPWPNSDRIEGTPYIGKAKCQAMLDRFTARGLNRAGDGAEFKRAAINGEFQKLADALRGYPLLVVGPPSVAALADFLGHHEASFVEIHNSEARGSRHDIFNRVNNAIHATPRTPVVLIQAGSLAAWLTIKLRESSSSLTVLDLGNTLNICNVPVVANQNWGKVYCREIASTIMKVNPEWKDSSKAFPGIENEAARRQVWTSLSTGREGALVALADAAGCERPVGPARQMTGTSTRQRPLAFIENKIPDHERVRQFSALSERKNAYANGGPVSRLLEQAVARLHGAADRRAYVAMANCTVGLHVLAGIEAVKRGGDIRWATSAFTFFSATTGPFKDCKIVDCNVSGVLDRQALEEFGPRNFDGVIYTNIFGANAAIDDLVAFCRYHGKALIVDNATGLLDLATADGVALPQAISFHHTKPWGFGEGGMVVIDPADEALARQLINFGNGAPNWARHYASNGKISDYSCALILDRLERMRLWGARYQMQLRRIMALIEQQSLPLIPLWNAPPKSPVSSIPLLAPQPVPPAMLANEHVVLRKYYRPLNWTSEDMKAWSGAPIFPIADGIFRRIVNFPVHPELAALSDEAVGAVLRQISTAK